MKRASQTQIMHLANFANANRHQQWTLKTWHKNAAKHCGVEFSDEAIRGAVQVAGATIAHTRSRVSRGYTDRVSALAAEVERLWECVQHITTATNANVHVAPDRELLTALKTRKATPQPRNQQWFPTARELYEEDQ